MRLKGESPFRLQQKGAIRKTSAEKKSVHLSLSSLWKTQVSGDAVDEAFLAAVG